MLHYICSKYFFFRNRQNFNNFLKWFVNRHQQSTLQFKNIKSTLYRKRQAKVPKNPQSVSEIIDHFDNTEIFDAFGTSLHQEKSAFYDFSFENRQFSYCIFSSKRCIHLIQDKIPINERHILMDATFKVVPKSPFTQLLIIYVRYHKKVG